MTGGNLSSFPFVGQFLAWFKLLFAPAVQWTMAGGPLANAEGGRSWV